ncbi:MAG TPA: DegT/DnrJ/EryC1/StrS family aminotransferase [Candidatus Angelobacter sp.]|nr:DegT/DnrJ/EryC1/StrS family aminotransferase [Candidatus Angelobacter sp.]
MATSAPVQMSIPILDLKAQYATIKEEIQSVLNTVLERQHFILGPEVKALEQEVAQYCGRKYAVGVASGTDALILGLRACGIGPGDEVIVPSFTFIATADVVSLLGATPVFVDIQPGTFNLDPAKIKPLINSRTKAIIPVHLYGQSADMDPILELAKEHNLKVIEDTAQAIGSTYKGRRAASMGDVGCISFFPSKNLGCYGDGGMVVIDSEEIYRRLISLRAHGSTKKYFSEEQGWNSRLDELQAAILRVKLRHLDQWSEGRRAAAARYDHLLQNVPGVTLPERNGFGDHVFHQYTIRVQERDLLQKRLADSGVSTMVYYPVPIHLQPIYASLGVKEGALPHTEAACREVISLPMFPELTGEQSEYVVDMLKTALKR